MKRYSVLLYVIVSVIIAIVLSVYIGAFELPDSFFFYAIGRFLYTGQQAQIWPFNLTIPLTLNAPVYGLFVAPLLWKPHPVATIVIPFLQLLMVSASGLVVYVLSGKLVGSRWNGVGLSVFFLLPFLFVYAMVLMSEIPAMFLVSLYVYAAYRVVADRRYHPGLLVFLSAVLTLTRFVFSFLFYASVLYWVWSEGFLMLRRKNGKLRLYPWSSRVLALTGIIAVCSWMSFNLKYHHTFSLYNQSGRALYYGSVAMAHLLPPKNSQVMRDMMSRIPSEDALYSPNNGAVLYFAPEFQAGKITETQMDTFFLRFAKEAIRNNFRQYVTVIGSKFIRMPMAYPYHAKLTGLSGIPDPECPGCTIDTCRIIWNPQSCSPAVRSPAFVKAFGKFILFERSLYPLVTLALFAVAMVGVFAGILQGGFLRLLGLAFLFFHSVQLVGVLDSRYMIPLYPVYAIVIVSGLKYLAQIFRVRPR